MFVSCILDPNPGASLAVSPDREQLFIFDEVNLSCEGSSAEWRVKRYYNGLDRSDCSFWGTMTGSVCSLKDGFGIEVIYWCESASGQFSNAAKITIYGEFISMIFYPGGFLLTFILF